MLRNVSSTELIVLVVVLLVLFGGKKLPELGKGLGDAIREFKKGFETGESGKDKQDEA